MNSTKGAIHFEITASNEDLKLTLEESRQAILNSGKTAEAAGTKIEGLFKHAAIGAGALFDVLQVLKGEGIKGISETADTLKKQGQNILSDQLSLETKRLSIMEEGRKNRLAQSNLEHIEQKAALKKEYDDTVAEYKKSGKAVPEEVTTTYNKHVTEADNAKTARDTGINDDADKEFKAHQKSLTVVAQTEEGKRIAAIKERYDKERLWAEEQFKNGNMSAGQHDDYKADADQSQQSETLELLLKQYQSYADKRKKIEDQFNAEIAVLQSGNKDGKYDAQIDRAEKSKKAALAAADYKDIKTDFDFTQLFDNLDNLSLPSMKSLRDKIKAWIDTTGQSLSSKDFKEVSEAFKKMELKISVKNPFGELGASLRNIKKETRNVAEAQEAYNAALALANEDKGKKKNKKKNKSEEEDNETPEVKAAEENLKKAKSNRSAAVDKATSDVKNIGAQGKQAVGAVQDIVGIMDNLGIKMPPGVAGVVEGVGQMMDGIASIDLKNPMSIVTGAIKIIGGLVKTITSALNGDNKKENEIKRLQAQVDVLKKSYAAMNEAVEKAYSTDASQMIEQQNEMLNQQKVLIQNQIAAEQSKKNADGGKIEAWQQQLDEINKTQAANKEKALDAIFGEDLKSAIDNFATAYADAWAKGEDRSKSAKDTVRNMMRQMVTESIKAAIQSSKAMEEIRNKLKEFYSDKVLTQFEQDAIYGMSENLQKELDQQFGWADSLMTDEEPEKSREASSKGIASMSQDSANELNGSFAAMQVMLFDMKNNQVQQLQLQSLHLPNLQYLSQLSHLSTISENTAYCRRLEGIENDMSVVKGELQTMNLKGLIIRK